MINIEIFTTSFRVECSDLGIIGDNKDFSIKLFLNFNLAEYEYVQNKPKVLKYKYAFYDKHHKHLYMPRYYIDNLIKTLKRFNRNYHISYIPPNRFSLIKNNIRSHYKDKEKQVPVIDYLLSSNNNMRCVELQTGFGKTYIAIKVAIQLKRTFLIVPPAHLISQWKKEILSITDLTEDDIYIIQEKESIFTLDKELKQKKYKCYLCSISTLTNFIQNNNGIYDNFISFRDFIKKLRIGVKIVDEVHLRFYQITLLDLMFNVDINIYLSATYIRSNRQSNNIFQKIFPISIRYVDNDYMKYTNITEYNYSIGYINPKIVMTMRGYNQIRYEKYLLNRPTKFDALYDIISSIFYNKYLKIKDKNDKCLIIVKMRNFAKLIAHRLNEEYFEEHLKINEYLSETPKTELIDLDVISSTIGSCGVGVDIKNLRTVILFDSFKSESWIYQTLGRLRQLKGKTPEFAFMHNRDLPSHIFHRKYRREIFIKLTDNYNIVDL